MSNAIEYIAKHLDPIKILTYYDFKNINENDSTIRACCKIHNGNNPTGFVWRKDNNLWYCYTGDCYGGDVFTLVEKIEGISFPEAVAKVAHILDLDITDMKIRKPSTTVINDTKKWLEYMQSSNKKNEHHYEMPYTKHIPIESYRCFDKKTIENFGATKVNIFPTETIMLKNKICIPIYFEKKQVGTALRSIDNSHPKWLYHPKGLKISNYLYNFDNALEHVKENQLTDIVIVEGKFDVWSYYQVGIKNVVGIFGSSLSKQQASLLLKTGLEWVLSLDNDDSGNKCRDDIRKKYKYVADLSYIDLPENSDPGDILEKEPELLIKLYQNKHR